MDRLAAPGSKFLGEPRRRRANLTAKPLLPARNERPSRPGALPQSCPGMFCQEKEPRASCQGQISKMLLPDVAMKDFLLLNPLIKAPLGCHQGHRILAVAPRRRLWSCSPDWEEPVWAMPGHPQWLPHVRDGPPIEREPFRPRPTMGPGAISGLPRASAYCLQPDAHTVMPKNAP